MKKTVIPLLLSALSGLLVMFSFPDYDWYNLIWFALVPVLYVSYHVSNRMAFWSGFTCGMLVYMGNFWWVTYSMIHFGGMPKILAFFCLVMFSMYHSFIFAFAMYIPKRLATELKLSPFFVYPLVYTLFAFFYPTLFPSSVGHCQIENPYLSQIGDLVGVNVMNILVLFSNLLVLHLCLEKKTFFKKHLYHLVGFLLVIFLSHGYGYYKIKTINATPTERIFKTVIVQGALGIDMLETPGFVQKSRETYFSLTSKFKDLDLITWPESPIPLSYTLNSYYRRSMDELANIVNSNIIFGSVDARYENDRRIHYSSSFLIGPNKEYQYYDKMRLLPFGDFMPFEDYFPFLRQVVEQVGNFKPGKEIKTLDVNGVKIAPSICYEILISSINLKMKRLGAEIIVNMTNDTWFGPTKESYQHMQLGRWRAVELRLPIIRATNSGVSAYIDYFGQITEELGLKMQGTLSKNVELKKIKSLYAFWGDIPLYIYFLISSLIIILRTRVSESCPICKRLKKIMVVK